MINQKAKEILKEVEKLLGVPVANSVMDLFIKIEMKLDYTTKSKEKYKQRYFEWRKRALKSEKELKELKKELRK